MDSDSSDGEATPPPNDPPANQPSPRGDGTAASTDESRPPVDRPSPGGDFEKLGRSLKGPRNLIKNYHELGRLLFGPGTTFQEVLEGLSAVSLGRTYTEKAFNIISMLNEYTFDREKLLWPKDLTSHDFVLWVLGTSIRSRPTGEVQSGAAFVSSTRVQKLCYLLREYVAPANLQFSYDMYPYGVYSVDVLSSLERLHNSSRIVRPKNALPGDEFRREPYVYKITKKGIEAYSRICESLDSSWGSTEVSWVRTLVDELYEQKPHTLGLASKLHFTWAYWTPVHRLQYEAFHQFLTDGASERHLAALDWFADRFRKYQRYLEYNHPAPDMPSDVDSLLRRSMAAGSFDSRRFFAFTPSGIPTNYFVPVETIQVNPFLLRLVAARVSRLVESTLRNEGPAGALTPGAGASNPRTLDCILVPHSGLASEVARLVVDDSRWRARPLIVGPYLRAYPNTSPLT